jgi:N-acetylmuramoyl-L-alanine amidase
MRYAAAVLLCAAACAHARLPVATAPPTIRPAATPRATASPVRSYTVLIDPGHDGGNATHPSEVDRLVDAVTLRKPCDTTGTATDSGYAESAFNLDVALRLAAILRARGVHVVMTRTTDAGWGPCITERAAAGNRIHADAAISIHADGGPSSGRGFHVIEPGLVRGYTDAIVAPSRRLGADVRDAYRAGTGMPYATYLGSDGIDVRTDLGGLNLSKVPKVFVECGNMRNATDAALLERAAFRARIAAALGAGLTAFLGTR